LILFDFAGHPAIPASTRNPIRGVSMTEERKYAILLLRRYCEEAERVGFGQAGYSLHRLDDYNFAAT